MTTFLSTAAAGLLPLHQLPIPALLSFRSTLVRPIFRAGPLLLLGDGVVCNSSPRTSRSCHFRCRANILGKSHLLFLNIMATKTIMMESLRSGSPSTFSGCSRLVAATTTSSPSPSRTTTGPTGGRSSIEPYCAGTAHPITGGPSPLRSSG